MPDTKLADRTPPATTTQDGMLQWRRADGVTSAMSAIKLSPTEGTVSAQYTAIKPRFETSVEGTVYWLLLNFMKVVLGEDERAWAYFSGNLDYLTDQLGTRGAAGIRSTAKAIWDRHRVAIIGGASGARRSTPADRTPPKTKDKVPTPKLDQAIDLVDALSNTALPAGVKSALKGVKSSLELARAAKQDSDPATYAKHVAGLAEAVFETIGELVKSAGQDVQLAGQAADQLGKIAKLLGIVGKVITAITAIHKIIYGKDRGEQIDAAIDLITTLGGTVGFAAGVSLGTYKWLWNHIGVPIKQATEELGLRTVFDRKSPEEVKAELDALAATEPGKAAWAVGRMRYKVFKPISSPFAPGWNTRDAWERFLRRDSSDNIDARVANAFKRGYTPGSDPMLDLLVDEAKQQFRRKGHQFIDSVVAEARSWK